MRLGQAAWRWLDIIFLTLLSCYVMTGYKLIPLFGDEPMLVQQSSDFYLLIEGQWDEFLTPWSQRYRGEASVYDELARRRLIDGQFVPHVWGALFYISGYPYEQLLGYDWLWEDDLEANRQAGNVPPIDMLFLGRTASTLALIVSMWLLFALSKQLFGRPITYLLILCYILSPFLLYQTRRIKQESFLLALSLGLFFISYFMARRWQRGRMLSWKDWAVFGVVAGCLLATKFNGVATFAACLLWLAWAWWHGKPSTQLAHQHIARGSWRLLGASVLSAGVFWLISIGYWLNPFLATVNMLVSRSQLTDILMRSNPDSVLSSPLERVNALILRPLSSQASLDSGGEGIDVFERYLNSGYAGKTLLATDSAVLLLLVGAIGVCTYMMIPRFSKFLGQRRSDTYLAGLVGLILAIGMNAALLMFNPLNWQRYYLPLTPFYLLLIGVGVWGSFVLVSYGLSSLWRGRSI